MNKPAKKKKPEAPAERDGMDENEELDADELGSVLWGALGDDSPMRGAGEAAY
jgi:hypothetical protein